MASLSKIEQFQKRAPYVQGCAKRNSAKNAGRTKLGGLFASGKLFNGECAKLVGTDDAALDKFDDLLGYEFGCHIFDVA